MPLFSYEAADSQGKKVRASMEASDATSLKTALRTKGLIPLQITPVEGRQHFTLKRVTKKDLLVFTQELGSLLESGLPLDRALFVLSEHSEKEVFRSMVREIYIDIQRGQSLSQALSRHNIFPRLYVNMIKAGETGGILEAVVKRIAAFLETSASFKEEIISALIYPILLTFVGGAAVAVLMFFVIPKFAVIFADMGQSLPLPTLILMKISSGFVSYWWAVAGALALIVIAVRSYSKTHEGRVFIDLMKLRLPVIKGLHMKFIIARFSRTLGTLLQSGVPILEAIRIAREVVGNQVVSERLRGIEEGVMRGRGIYTPLEESAVFPPVVAQMIAVGEEAGRLEETFLLIAERFEGESKSLIKRTVSLFEPALILLMGLVVGFIVVSMLLAVFSVNELPI